MINRQHERISADIPVTIVSVFDRQEGRIVDISAGGALVVDASLPGKSRCQIEYQGQTVFATVMWSEEDRMGIRFPFSLVDGPLYEAIVAARRASALLARPSGDAAFGRRGATL